MRKFNSEGPAGLFDWEEDVEHRKAPCHDCGNGTHGRGSYFTDMGGFANASICQPCAYKRLHELLEMEAA